MVKKKEGPPPSLKTKQTSIQKLERGQKADHGTTPINRMQSQYAKKPPLNDDDFMGAFSGRL